jgi:hypothetical protein
MKDSGQEKFTSIGSTNARGELVFDLRATLKKAHPGWPESSPGIEEEARLVRHGGKTLTTVNLSESADIGYREHKAFREKRSNLAERKQRAEQHLDRCRSRHSGYATDVIRCVGSDFARLPSRTRDDWRERASQESSANLVRRNCARRHKRAAVVIHCVKRKDAWSRVRPSDQRRLQARKKDEQKNAGAAKAGRCRRKCGSSSACFSRCMSG